jgi:hypothetical protein
LLRRRAGEGLSHAAQVNDNGLDAVALAFNLGLNALHLVAVEGVRDIAANVDGGHGDGGAGDWYERLLLVKQREDERGQIGYVDEGRKRHATMQSLGCRRGCVCVTRGREGQCISRWFGGGYC